MNLSLFKPRCLHNAQTTVELNGVSKEAHFSFETFRFVEHNNLTVSTFYVHCAATLCEKSTCSLLLSVSPHCMLAEPFWEKQWAQKTEAPVYAVCVDVTFYCLWCSAEMWEAAASRDVRLYSHLARHHGGKKEQPCAFW